MSGSGFQVTCDSKAILLVLNAADLRIILTRRMLCLSSIYGHSIIGKLREHTLGWSLYLLPNTHGCLENIHSTKGIIYRQHKTPQHRAKTSRASDYDGLPGCRIKNISIRTGQREIISSVCC